LPEIGGVGTGVDALPSIVEGEHAGGALRHAAHRGVVRVPGRRSRANVDTSILKLIRKGITITLQDADSGRKVSEGAVGTLLHALLSIVSGKAITGKGTLLHAKQVEVVCVVSWRAPAYAFPVERVSESERGAGALVYTAPGGVICVGAVRANR
jgi:hypothetical protein